MVLSVQSLTVDMSKICVHAWKKNVKKKIKRKKIYIYL